MRHCKVFFLTVALLIFLVACWALQSNAFVSRQASKPSFAKVAGTTADSTFLPNVQLRVQRVGGIDVCQTNWGIIGSYGRQFSESIGGCFNPHPDSEVAAPSFEFPEDSGLDYLFSGAVWVGAKVDGTPYVSVGWEGSSWGFEMWPDGPAPLGSIEELSRIPQSSCYSPTALSDQDVFCRYTDTLLIKNIFWDGPFWDYVDMRWHHPLGVEVTRKTYSWAEPQLSHFIIADYSIKNIGPELLTGLCLGLFLDTDIYHFEHPYSSQGCTDDITGFLKHYEVAAGDTEEVDIAWAADNDGWVESNQGLEWGVRHIIGAKILNISESDAQLSYNWWRNGMPVLPYDWGPWKSENQAAWAQQNCYEPGDSFFPHHVLGTPGGDCSKYFIMTNGEIDYDQVYSCTWASEHPEQGWLEPNELCEDFADGTDIRFLLSFGPIDQLAPGASIDFAVAYLMGENFHTDPNNGQNLPENPDSFYAHVDFSDLVQKALVAQRLYDSLLCSPTSVQEPENNQPHSVPVSLKIYNILGQSVRTLVDQRQTGGKHEILWDGKDNSGKDVASGVYFYRLKAGESIETRRMVLIR
jgi:hypothetical protein